MGDPLSIEACGIEFAVHREGARSGAATVLCLHETGATGASWLPLSESLTATDGIATVRYDRRGWGGTEVPQLYTRTTVAEQAQDALGLLDALGVERAILCGAGLGAVAAVDLALREPARAEAVIAVELPLLALAEGTTEGLSDDVEALREAAEAAIGEMDRASSTARHGLLSRNSGVGLEAAAGLFLSGDLPFLAPGSKRLRSRERAGGGDGLQALRRPATMLAELGAVPAWPLPFEALAAASVPISLVIGKDTPPPVRAAASALIPHAVSAELVDLDCEDPLDGDELARLVTGGSLPI